MSPHTHRVVILMDVGQDFYNVCWVLDDSHVVQQQSPEA